MNQLSSDDLRADLHRAVVISLFTWRRAGPDDPLDDAEAYGWWGDSLPTVADDRIGSRLYLLRRRTLTQQTLNDAEHYAREALAWLIEDGQAQAVDVSVTRHGNDRADALVMITLPDGAALNIELSDMWKLVYAV